MTFDLTRLKKCGVDVRIAPLAVLRSPELATCGDHIAIDDFNVITTALDLGSYIHIASHCSIIGGAASRCVIGDFAGCAAGCRIICASEDFLGQYLTNPTIPARFRRVKTSTVTIERCATLGTGAIVLPGVTIGEGAFVAPGTVVGKSLAPWGIYRGNPVRRIGTRPKDAILKLAEECLRESR